jgi:hypothetical protein
MGNGSLRDGWRSRVVGYVIVAAISATISGIGTWMFLRASMRVTRLATSRLQYQGRWEREVFLHLHYFSQMDHRIFVALQKANARSLARPVIAFASIGVSDVPGGKAARAAMLLIWIGEHPDADAVLLRPAAGGKHATFTIAIPKYQQLANRISSRTGVAYSVVLMVPIRLLGRPGSAEGGGYRRCRVALSRGGRRTTPWFTTAPRVSPAGNHANSK